MSISIKAATFNILTYKPDGINSFENRMPLIRKAVNSEAPDLIGFQEVKPGVQEWLRKSFPRYSFVGCGRNFDFKDESNPIAYNMARFDLCWLDMFWLSPTPEIPGSRFEEQSDCPRICMAARFYDRKNRRLIAFYNTHLDHLGERARQLGMRQILAKIEKDCELFDIPVILTGDFNAAPDSVAVTETLAFKAHPLKDVTSELEYTYHDFGKSKEKIDYIFTDKNALVSGVKIWESKNDRGTYISDHYPASAEILF